ncbi:MAG TPA: M48 family metalloprotease [Steroidobacteraceae bacterium]|nr:M48 family metalloprotease [Steroidobacteraceae bacterium]
MRFLRHNLLQKLILFLGLAAFTAGSTLAIAQSEADLPDIGYPGGELIGKNDEYDVALMALREMRAQNVLIEDPESTEYIQSLGTRLAAQSLDGAAHFHYVVFNDSDINAEAVPGGLIFCNYGLILATANESELAGVLAHETAHVTQHHGVRGAEAQTRQTLTAAAAMLAAIVIGAMGGGAPAVEGGIAAAQGMMVQQEINFSRGEEEEADRIGMGYLAAAGFDPEGMPDFFETFLQRYGYQESLYPKFLIDHPIFPDRIADARARAAQLPRPRNLKDSVSYGLIKERLRVITAPEDYDILGYYHKLATIGPPTLSDQYGLALALMRLNRPREAVAILQPLVTQNQSVTLLRSALGQAQVAAGDVPGGLKTFADAEVLFPRNVALSVRYAETLIKVGRPRQAHQLLDDLFDNAEPTPRQIELIAQAASAAGDMGDAYDYMGEYYIANGSLTLATQQFELALRVPHLTNVQRERFAARLSEIRDFLAEVRRENHGRLPQGMLGGESSLDESPISGDLPPSGDQPFGWTH